MLQLILAIEFCEHNAESKRKYGKIGEDRNHNLNRWTADSQTNINKSGRSQNNDVRITLLQCSLRSHLPTSARTARVS